MLLLKVMLKESMPNVYEKFLDIGLPLEYYFAEHMLSLFAGFFNTELTFRIWDLLFLEGSQPDQSRSTWVIILAVFVLIRQNQSRIL